MDLTEEMYRQKYLKYKKKYTILKQKAGVNPFKPTGVIKGVCDSFGIFYCFEKINVLKGNADQNVTSHENFISFTEFYKESRYKAYELQDLSLTTSKSGNASWNRLGISYGGDFSISTSVRDKAEKRYSNLFNIRTSILDIINWTITPYIRIPNTIRIDNLNIKEDIGIITYLNDMFKLYKINYMFSDDDQKISENSPATVRQIVTFFGGRMTEVLDVIYKVNGTIDPEINLVNSVNYPKQKLSDKISKILPSKGMKA